MLLTNEFPPRYENFILIRYEVKNTIFYLIQISISNFTPWNVGEKLTLGARSSDNRKLNSKTVQDCNIIILAALKL
jgi:hypothetical protein